MERQKKLYITEIEKEKKIWKSKHYVWFGWNFNNYSNHQISPFHLPLFRKLSSYIRHCSNNIFYNSRSFAIKICFSNCGQLLSIFRKGFFLWVFLSQLEKLLIKNNETRSTGQILQIIFCEFFPASFSLQKI